MTFNKEKLVVEDMVLSMDSTVIQDRGVLTPFNAAYLPYTATENVAYALDSRYTSIHIDANFAKLNGDVDNAFNVKVASGANEAVSLGQMDVELLLLEDGKADKNAVLLKTDPDGLNDGYIPANDYSPATKKYADGLIADKFLGAVTGKFRARNVADDADVVVTVTNGVITEIL